MRRLLGTTRGRLMAFAAVILAVALMIGDGAVLASLALVERNQSDSVLVAQSRVLSATIEDRNGQLFLEAAGLPGETEAGIAVDAAVVSPAGALAQTSAQPLSTRVLTELAGRALAAGKPIWADLVDGRGVPRRAYATPIAGGSGQAPVLIVSRSVGEMENTLRRTLVLLGLVSVTLLAVGMGLAYWLAGRALRPVRQIAGLARSISEHDLHRRVEVEVPPDELGELVDTFNGMLARLESSFESLGRFTADASHELRAPLALMQSELEGALSRNRTREEYRRVLNTLSSEVDHLSRLADHLLLLARADAGALVPAPESIDVADFLHEIASRWEVIAGGREVGVEVAAPDAGFMRADPRLIRRVLDNLLDNAIRYAPAGSTIQLRGYPAGGGWNLEVADQGPGVPSERRRKLFTRFGKPDPARTPEGSGAGLGLALSAAIARAHGGTLELVDSPGPGAVFRLHIPG